MVAGLSPVLCWDATGHKQEQQNGTVQMASLNMQVLPNQNIAGTVQGKNQGPENFSGGSELLSLHILWFGMQRLFFFFLLCKNNP